MHLQASVEGVEGSDSGNGSGTSRSDCRWLDWYVELPGKHFLLQVPEPWIDDAFNLHGLREQLPMYEEAIRMITNRALVSEMYVYPGEMDFDNDEEEDRDSSGEYSESPGGEDWDENTDGSDRDDDERAVGKPSTKRRIMDAFYPMKAFDHAETRRNLLHLTGDQRKKALRRDVEQLYACIHARWTCTERGLDAAVQYYQAGLWGLCPNLSCEACFIIPYGFSHLPGRFRTAKFCPGCCEVYWCGRSEPLGKIDGVAWGPDFAAYLMQHMRNIGEPKLPKSCSYDMLKLPRTSPPPTSFLWTPQAHHIARWGNWPKEYFDKYLKTVPPASSSTSTGPNGPNGPNGLNLYPSGQAIRSMGAPSDDITNGRIPLLDPSERRSQKAPPYHVPRICGFAIHRNIKDMLRFVVKSRTPLQDLKAIEGQLKVEFSDQSQGKKHGTNPAGTII